MRAIRWCVNAVMIPALLLAGCGKSGPKSPVKPSYTIRKAVKAPVVDGTLDDACWKDLPAMDLALCTGGKPKQPGSVRMTYDESNLYVGFECQDTDAASTVAEFDGPVTDEEYVALCIDAGCDSTGYFLLAVAPTGAISDAFVLNGGNGAAVRVLSGWNCPKLRASVAVYGGGAQPGDTDRFWTVEMAIPFAEMVTASRVPPGPGDVWRMNGYRLELTGGRELSACSATGADDIHRPQQFAAMTFGK